MPGKTVGALRRASIARLGEYVDRRRARAASSRRFAAAPADARDRSRSARSRTGCSRPATRWRSTPSARWRCSPPTRSSASGRSTTRAYLEACLRGGDAAVADDDDALARDARRDRVGRRDASRPGPRSLIVNTFLPPRPRAPRLRRPLRAGALARRRRRRRLVVQPLQPRAAGLPGHRDRAGCSARRCSSTAARAATRSSSSRLARPGEAAARTCSTSSACASGSLRRPSLAASAGPRRGRDGAAGRAARRRSRRSAACRT